MIYVILYKPFMYTLDTLQHVGKLPPTSLLFILYLRYDHSSLYLSLSTHTRFIDAHIISFRIYYDVHFTAMLEHQCPDTNFRTTRGKRGGAWKAHYRTAVLDLKKALLVC